LPGFGNETDRNKRQLFQANIHVKSRAVTSLVRILPALFL
jgi:hypothetical protein